MDKPKVLLVDDEDAIRLACKFAFDTWFNITTTDTTTKALEILEQGHFDIVLLDIISRLEGENAGIEALKIINKKYPKLPVVMLSGSLYWAKKWDELRKLGASGYLNKPFDRDKGKEIIDRCLKGEKMENIM